jgi:hypothetical protein
LLFSLGGIAVKTPFRTGLKFLSLSVLILMTACGSPKRTTSDTDTDPNSGTDTGAPLFDTSATSPTGTSTENLFTTQTGTQVQQTAPAQGSSQLGQLSQVESQCLSNNSGFGLGSYGAAPSNGSQSASASCLNTNSFGVQPSQMYDAAITSYQAADYCLGQAATKFAPKQGSQFDVELSIQLAELSLIRCMRDIIQFQSSSFPWANNHASAFQHADHNLWSIGQGMYH